jgi:catechol 2,3-dioxygenase-like lactoylglutathione lyase family enzyme
MKLGGLHHLNVRCAKSDLPAIEKFYTEVLGLKKGYRPDFNNEGIWLYDGDHAIVHVSARCPEGFLRDTHTGSIDHIAFRATGAGTFRERVRGLGVAFEEQNVPNAGYQIFLRDPVGSVLEFNFPNEEAPGDITSGTMAPRTQAPIA